MCRPGHLRDVSVVTQPPPSNVGGASVVLQRHLLPRWQLRILRRYARHLIFDFDDAVFLRDSYSPRGLRDPRRLRRFAATVRACDAVLAGNPFLFDHAARWAGVARVHLVPTCVHRHLSRIVDAPREQSLTSATTKPPADAEGRSQGEGE